MRVDIVRELIQRLLQASAAAGQFNEALASRVEFQFRQDYGGDEYYIKKLPSAMDARQVAVTQAYLRGDTPTEIASDHSISRATMYRFIKR